MEELRNLFIKLSTNRDVRTIKEYYKNHNLKEKDIETDFYDTLENLESEEIDERLDYLVADNLKDIDITPIEVFETLTHNPKCNDSQLQIIAKQNLSRIAIQNIIDNIYAELETIDLAIKNSTANDLYLLVQNELNIDVNDEETTLTILYLDSSSILKLLNQTPDNSQEQELLLYYLSLKPELEVENINLILNKMKINNIKMDMLYGESLLEQENITEEQIRKIATFEEIPDPSVFEICLEKGIYTEEEIYEYFKKESKHTNSIEMILIENKYTPSTILQKIYNEVDKYSKQKIDQKLNNKEVNR